MSTIFAAITGRGGAVTVVRLSGPLALAITQRLAGHVPPPRRVALRGLQWQGRLLDRALVVFFRAPGSFTGEDTTEFSLHGGPAVFAALSEALVEAGARPAEPGEFSRRAYQNGRLDLLAAEAMADLIAAETQAQRVQALDGALGTAQARWRRNLVQAMARQEALIDFPDEDLPAEVEDRLLHGIRILAEEIEAALAAAPAAERLREGLEFVILGAPNAGKSTLLNALAGEAVAIVSATPGTTRDVLGARVVLGGVPVRITDTAGLRETAEEIEAEGVRRARARAANADLVLAVAAAPHPAWGILPEHGKVLRVVTKSDIMLERVEEHLCVSALTGAGMDLLREQLAQAARTLTDTRGAPAPGRPRQVAALSEAAAALRRALGVDAAELRGEELRAAAHALARLTGHVGVEEVLDEVFSGFCIGK